MEDDFAYQAFSNLATCVLSEVLVPGEWNLVLSVYGPESIVQFLDFASKTLRAAKHKFPCVSLSLIDRHTAAIGIGRTASYFSFPEKQEVAMPLNPERVLALQIRTVSQETGTASSAEASDCRAARRP